MALEGNGANLFAFTGSPDLQLDNIIPLRPLPGQISFDAPEFPRAPIAASGLALEFGPELEAKKQIRTDYRTLKFSEINAIVQARDEYEGIEELAEAIEEAGIVIHDPLVAEFNEEEARGYLNFVNGIYGDKVPERKRFSDLVPSQEQGHEVFYIVIAGHRRLRALELNGADQVGVKVLKGLGPFEALVLQAQENTPKLLKDYERAEQHGRLWAVFKARETDLTREEFARRMNTNTKTITRDLHYYSLPEKVKGFVVPNKRKDTGRGDTIVEAQPYLMPFTVASQLGRLVDAGVPEHDIVFLALNMFREGTSSEQEAGKRVTAYLRARKMDIANDISSLFGENYEIQAKKALKSRESASRFVPAFDEPTALLARTIMAMNMGLSYAPEDKIAYAGVASKLLAFVDQADKFVEKGEEYFSSPEEVQRVQEVLKRMQEFAQGIQSEGSENVVFDSSRDQQT